MYEKKVNLDTLRRKLEEERKALEDTQRYLLNKMVEERTALDSIAINLMTLIKRFEYVDVRQPPETIANQLISLKKDLENIGRKITELPLAKP